MSMQIEDHGAFGVYSYKRPTGHTKTGARHRGETPWVIELAFVLRDGPAWVIGASRPGFATRDAAIQAAISSLAGKAYR